MNVDKQFRKRAIATLTALGALAASPALAQEERSSAPSLPEAASEEPATAAGTDRMQTLEERLGELNERLRESEEARQKSVSPLSWNGYVDFGYFAPLGNNGVGWIRDDGPMDQRQFPQYFNYSWTFLGDILS